jgi:hypothetical protein
MVMTSRSRLAVRNKSTMNNRKARFNRTSESGLKIAALVSGLGAPFAGLRHSPGGRGATLDWVEDFTFSE